MSLLVAASGCSSQARLPMEIDCNAGEGYELQPFQAFEGQGFIPPWFGFGDDTPGGTWGMPSDPTVVLPPPPVEDIEGEDGRCGSLQAMVLRSNGHRDWGSGFGDFATQGAPVDATGFDGLAFWARSPGNTTKELLFTVADVNTSAAGFRCTECENHGDCTDIATPQCTESTPGPGGAERGVCACTADLAFDPNNCGACGVVCPVGQWCNFQACTDTVGDTMSAGCGSDDDCNAGSPFCDAGVCVQCQRDEDCGTDNCGSGVCGSGGRCLFEDGTDLDDTCGPNEVCLGTGEYDCSDNVSSGFIGSASGNPTLVVPGNFCGNSFRILVDLTEGWQLHLFPFDQFAQDPLPSRSPTGIDRSGLYQFGFTIPKEAVLEFWLDDLSLYRRLDE